MKVSSFTCGSYFGSFCILVTDDVVHIINDDVGLIGSYRNKEEAFSTLIEEMGYDVSWYDKDVLDLRQLFNDTYSKGVEV